ncbi:MAG TPA: hypothetical protein VI566_13705, partial [Xanthomonadales bacterium]|nr:hypothetical protein [Xanthomonadales bacterium]
VNTRSAGSVTTAGWQAASRIKMATKEMMILDGIVKALMCQIAAHGGSRFDRRIRGESVPDCVAVGDACTQSARNCNTPTLNQKTPLSRGFVDQFNAASLA